MNETLLKRIDQLCREKNISKRQLQIAVGMSQGAIAKWKTSAPSLDKLEKIASYFDVSIDYLQGKTDFKNQLSMLEFFDQRYQPKENQPSWFRPEIIRIAEILDTYTDDELDDFYRFIMRFKIKCTAEPMRNRNNDN